METETENRHMDIGRQGGDDLGDGGSYIYTHTLPCGFLVALMVKNPPVDARDVRDAGLTPGSGRASGERNGNVFQLLLLGKSCGQRSLAGSSP